MSCTYTLPSKFTRDMLNGIEWQRPLNLRTMSGEFRVEISWSLDRYTVSVYRRIQEPEKLVRKHVAFYDRTVLKTANALLRKYDHR